MRYWSAASIVRRVSLLGRILLAAALSLALALPAWAGSAPSIDAEIIPEGWWVIGPFPSGVREAGTDALTYFDDDAVLENPLLQSSFPSWLVPGGMARWHYYESDEKGAVSLDFPEVTEESLELIVDEFGFAGAMMKSYAYATIEIEDGPRRALIDLQNAGGFRLNGVPWPADSYGHRLGPTPVMLAEGRNEFKISLGRRQNFTFRIMPVERDVLPLERDATLPDLVRGGRPELRMALPLVNCTEDWLTLESIRIDGAAAYAGRYECDVRIAPLSLYNCPIVLPEACQPFPADWAEEEYALSGEVVYDGGSSPFELTLRVRDPEQTRKLTFRSQIDDSVQYYGLLPPSDFDPTATYGLILSLHGAGVQASGQVGSYQPKDWAFVVAPTNRRRYGFDWQDWGRLDLLEVKADVERRYSIDPNRVHITGHSMGGHGTWYNAFTHPDLWASAAPSAGWTTFDLYVPMFLRQNVIIGDPRAQLIWNLAFREDNTLLLADNALNLPVYALEGGADDNVPPQQPRMLVDQLLRRGYDVVYEEVPGMGHWWSRPETPFTDCVDNERHNQFWRRHVRNPWPREVVFRTHNYSLSDGAYWVRVLAPERAYADTIVRARITDDGRIEVSTVNVAALQLDLSPELLLPGLHRLLIDGQQLAVDNSTWETVELVRQDGAWARGYPATPQLAKTPQTYGPWRQAMMRPFEIVYGSSGSAEQTDFSLQLARLYSYHWWYRGNGTARIIADTECDPASGRNLILLGGPDSNAITAQLIDRMPIRPVEGGVVAGDRLIAGEDLSYKYVYPNPETDWRTLVLIEGGTSLEAMQRLSSVMAVYSGAGFPEWLVWDDSFRLAGLGSALASGFFGMDWQLDPALTFWNEPLLAAENAKYR